MKTGRQVIDALTEGSPFVEKAYAYYILKEGVIDFNSAQAERIESLMFGALLGKQELGELPGILNRPELRRALADSKGTEGGGMNNTSLGLASLGNSTPLAKLAEMFRPPAAPRTRLGGWLSQQWAMLMLRRHFAARGVRVWALSDAEFKAQLREGLRRCVEMIEADTARRAASSSSVKE